jgi:hypothetical protein
VVTQAIQVQEFLAIQAIVVHQDIPVTREQVGIQDTPAFLATQDILGLALVGIADIQEQKAILGILGILGIPVQELAVTAAIQAQVYPDTQDIQEHRVIVDTVQFPDTPAIPEPLAIVAILGIQQLRAIQVTQEQVDTLAIAVQVFLVTLVTLVIAASAHQGIQDIQAHQGTQVIVVLE